MNGYCGECDKQIELHERNIEKKYGTTENVVFVYLVCPWCDDKELITKVKP